MGFIKLNFSKIMMTPAALGMTCKEAFQVFSSNETLQLQKRVAELEQRLSKYEPVHKPLRKFKCYRDYAEVRDKAWEELINWIVHNVHACTRCRYEHEKIWAICNPYSFIEAISCFVYKIVGHRNFSIEVASHASDMVTAALNAAHYTDRYHGEAWCNDPALTCEIIKRALDDWLSDCLTFQDAVDWEEADLRSEASLMFREFSEEGNTDGEDEEDDEEDD